ncbi:hypothetical protein ZTR_03792 [Talaromyces verruculosus]|nr:hypothetical protein ZTR_03792 [Talaromyces verruculosus]
MADPSASESISLEPSSTDEPPSSALKNVSSRIISNPDDFELNMAFSNTTKPIALGSMVAEPNASALDRKYRQQLCQNLAEGLGDELSDEQLREILQARNERYRHGDIINMDFVFRFVKIPHKHYGPIDDKSPVGILREATAHAVYKRLESHNNSITSYDADVTKDGYRIIARWHGKKPVLPDSLNDLSAFISFEEEEYDPEDIHPDDGSTVIPDSTMTKDPISPKLENLESKSASKANGSEPNATVSPEGLPLLEDMGAKNASEPTMTELINAPSERLHGRMEFENLSDPYATESNSSASNMAEPNASDSAMPYIGNGLENQLRQPKPGRERNHLHRVLSGEVGKQLSDQQLREILQKSPSERDYIGRITNVDYVSQLVSREHDGFFINDDLAANILQTATEKAVYRRFKHTGQIKRGIPKSPRMVTL